jgi:RNA polymerase sigma-70 factor (ECF subfamily)
LRQTKFNENEEDALQTNIDHAVGQQPVLPPRVAAKSDREALNHVAGSQRQRLFHTAFRLLGNAEDAEDAVQDGLLAAFRNLHRFQGRSQLTTWLVRIVVNAALMRLRSLRTHESQPIDDLMTEQGSGRFSDVLVDERPNPEQVCAQAEQRRILNQGLRGLSGPQRRALSLRCLEGMTTKEAADALGLSEGTVKSQIHRGRRKLLQHVRRMQTARALAMPAQA